MNAAEEHNQKGNENTSKSIKGAMHEFRGVETNRGEGFSNQFSVLDHTKIKR